MEHPFQRFQSFQGFQWFNKLNISGFPVEL
jgi:hypothetical protein